MVFFAVLQAFGAAPKRFRGSDWLWRIELHPEVVALLRVWSGERAVRYSRVTDVLVRYADIQCSYDRLELVARLDDGEELATGPCAARGEAVEEAAEELRRRVLGAGATECGSGERDRKVRLGQLRKIAVWNIPGALLLALPLLAALALMLGWAREDLYFRWLAVDAGAEVARTTPRPAGGVWVDYSYSVAPGERRQRRARLPAEYAGLKPGDALPARYHAERYDLAYLAAELPRMSWFWYGLLLLTAVAAIAAVYAVWLAFRGYIVCTARWRVFVIGPGELEDDRIRAWNTR